MLLFFPCLGNAENIKPIDIETKDKELLTYTEISEKGCIPKHEVTYSDSVYKEKYAIKRGDTRTTKYECPTWQFSRCDKDRFNGIKSCSIDKQGLIIGIINGAPVVIISSGAKEHYPNSLAAIKVDNNKAVYGVEGHFNNSNVIINQMLKGNVIFTRYRDWPYNLNNDKEIDLKGFKEAYEKLKEEYRSIEN